jgi:hypothetical protein
VGALAGAVILAAENVVDLQYVLMDAAKRLVGAGDAQAEADELLSNAAALDYALVLASQHADEEMDPESAVGSAVRDTMTRAASAALDAIERMSRSRDDVACGEFVERHTRPGGVLDVLRELRARGVTYGDELAFRTLTIASDAAERRR